MCVEGGGVLRGRVDELTEPLNAGVLPNGMASLEMLRFRGDLGECRVSLCLDKGKWF